MATDWVTVDASPEHERGLVYMWLEGTKRSRIGRSCPDPRTYWRSHVPVVEFLLRSPVTRTRVACDPDIPDSILAFSCTSGPTLHYATVKRAAVRAGFGTELLGAVVSDDMMRGSTGYTFEVPRLTDGEGASVWTPPRSWYPDTTWFARHLLGAA